MWKLFKRHTTGKQEPVPAGFSKLLTAWQQQFADFMTRQDNRFTTQQKKIFLLLFVLLILSVHFFNIYSITRPSPSNQRPASRGTIAIPEDIALPDSLDIRLIRQYRDMRRQQDSFDLENQ